MLYIAYCLRVISQEWSKIDAVLPYKSINTVNKVDSNICMKDTNPSD